MINHVTYHLTPSGLKGVGDLMGALGFQEVEPDDPFEHGYDVRWFKRAGSPLVHFVSDGDLIGDELRLGHICVLVNMLVWQWSKTCKYLTRDSGSGRIWLGYDNLRVEIRYGGPVS